VSRQIVAATLFCAFLLVPEGLAELADPTRPPGFGGEAAAIRPSAPLIVTSILVSSGRKIAVIDGRSVKVGDSIGGARILEIAPDTVVVRTRTGTAELRLALPSVKRPTPGDGGSAK
jgi:MSHA biogenesis protein MshK